MKFVYIDFFRSLTIIKTLFIEAAQLGIPSLPCGPLSNFNNIQYILTLKNNLLENIQYKDELENQINITFKKVQQNHKIDNSIFKFTIPYDYDVIKK